MLNRSIATVDLHYRQTAFEAMCARSVLGSDSFQASPS